MKNRLQYLLGPPMDALFNDLYEVDTLGGTLIVSFAIAHAIVRALDHSATPDWLEFRDVFGVEHHVLALCVYRVRYLNGVPGNVTPGPLATALWHD